MGVYDTVRVDLDYLKGEFQTKDLECSFDQYLVNVDGIHIKKNGKFYKVPWISDDIEIYEFNELSRKLEYYNLSFLEGELV